MRDSEKAALMLVSRLLEYPDQTLLAGLDDLCLEAEQSLEPANVEIVRAFCDALRKDGTRAAREDYVRTFDHDPAGSLYLSWHRYGNDRSQGKAMAALNGIYRAAGFEPVPGTLPDYLPRVFEFMAVCEDWAIEAILDGFGPELGKLMQNLVGQKSRHAPLLAMALAPLKRDFPQCFRPRTIDTTQRPMACPEEEALFR